MESKKFYWLKLKRDFFKRHDIRIIEGLPNGEKVILFYLKLMLESIDHEGELRFSKEIPYTSEMLATITDTNIEVVEQSLEILKKFGLLKIKKDETIAIDKVKTMIGFETEWAKQKRLWREAKGQTEDKEKTTEGQSQDNVLTMSDKSKSKSKRQSKSKSKENIKRNLSSFVPPTVEEVRAYCEERGNFIDPEAFVAFYDSKGWRVGNSPMKNWKSAVITWEKRNKPVKKEESFADLLERWEGEDG